MFNLTQGDVRNFFFEVFGKTRQNISLTAMEKIAYSVILEHPEYNDVLANKDKYFDFQYLPETGQTNPFLHLSLHMAIIEQLSIDQPAGICELYNQMCLKVKDEHTASHEVIDCLMEMMWHSQRNQTIPDVNIYFDCIRKKLATKSLKHNSL